MTKSPDHLLARLYDIAGLDYIGWWPLAPGWWALLAITVMAAAAAWWRRRAYQRSWKGDAWRKLTALDSGLAESNAQETVAMLSMLMRRIAMRRFSRSDCAGLEGPDWLRWLTAKDPGHFDWARRGVLLIETPYAPPGQIVPLESLKTLIKAAKRWVK